MPQLKEFTLTFTMDTTVSSFSAQKNVLATAVKNVLMAKTGIIGITGVAIGGGGTFRGITTFRVKISTPFLNTLPQAQKFINSCKIAGALLDPMFVSLVKLQVLTLSNTVIQSILEVDAPVDRAAIMEEHQCDFDNDEAFVSLILTQVDTFNYVLSTGADLPSGSTGQVRANVTPDVYDLGNSEFQKIISATVRKLNSSLNEFGKFMLKQTSTLSKVGETDNVYISQSDFTENFLAAGTSITKNGVLLTGGAGYFATSPSPAGYPTPPSELTTRAFVVTGSGASEAVDAYAYDFQTAPPFSTFTEGKSYQLIPSVHDTLLAEVDFRLLNTTANTIPNGTIVANVVIGSGDSTVVVIP
jgi:hypothetical protein